jgi:hypothetical protein
MTPKDISTTTVLMISLLAVGGALSFYLYPPFIGVVDDRGDDTDITRVDKDLPHYDAQDGTFETTIAYSVPNNHEETMRISITLKDNVVTATEISYVPSNGTSERYLNRFNEWHAAEVVGQPIDEIKLSRLGGASLTTVAFNNALADIMEQARSTR